LDQDLRCFTCEEGPDVVESNSTRSGHLILIGQQRSKSVDYFSVMGHLLLTWSGTILCKSVL